MMIQNVARYTAVTMLFIMMCFTVNAQAESTQCTAITGVPYTISTSGKYCLTGDIVSNLGYGGSAVTINASDVVIDLNGHTIINTGEMANGFEQGPYVLNSITIKNGTIKGFAIAIMLVRDSTGYGHLVEDIRAEMNGQIGIWVAGSMSIIRNNSVTGTSSAAQGISILGTGNRVINNDVIEANSFGIQVGYGSKNTIVDGNRIGNQTLGTGVTYGIWIDNSNDVLVTNNRVTRMNKGIYYNGATGAYMGNLIFGATTAFTGGTRVGSTNYYY